MNATDSPVRSAETINEMIAGNLGLIYREARRYARQGQLDFDELVSEGLIAMWRVARNWDESKGTIATYAVPSIRRQMWQAIGMETRRRQRLRYHQEPPTDRDVDHAPAVANVAAPCPAGDTATAAAQVVAKLLDQLSPAEAVLLRMRFGLAPYRQPLGPAAIAERVGLSETRVQQTLASARWTLRQQPFPQLEV